MKKSLAFVLTSNEILSAVGAYLIRKKYIEEGEYDRIIGFEFPNKEEWKFEVIKEDVKPTEPKDGERLNRRMIQI